MPINEWRPDKGMTEPGVFVHKVVALSQAQCDKLAELSGSLTPGQRLWLQQTKTIEGGTHLYVRVGDDEYHIARNGNVIKMGVVSQPRNRRLST